MGDVALGIAASIGVALVLVLILLGLPLHVAFQFEGLQAPCARFTVNGLFGLLRVGLVLPAAARDSTRVPERPVTKAQPAHRWPRLGGAGVLAALRQAAFRQRLLRLARDMLAAAHLQQLRLRLRLGLGDPADTGCLWAVVGPVAAWARTHRDAEVQIEPDFIDAVLEIQAQGRARIVPLQLLGLVAVFALSPVSLRAWRAFRAHHA